MKWFFIPLLLFAAAVPAEPGTVFETGFPTLPAGWTNDDWNFSYSMGAWIDEFICETGFDATMSSQGDPAVWYFVPDGTDSLVIHVEHDLYLRSSFTGEAYIAVDYLSGERDFIYNESVYFSSVTDSLPIDTTFYSPPADTWIGFEIHGEISFTYTSNSEIFWRITELTATAWGDGLILDSFSWGGIKREWAEQI